MTLTGKDIKSLELRRTLVDKAELQGYITVGDLLDLEVDDVDEDTYDELIRYLNDLGVNFIEDNDIGGVNPPTLHTPEKTYTPSNLEHIATDDTVSLYLKEMSVVPLLTHEEEIDYAKRIEQASNARLELVSNNGGIDLDRRKELENLIRDGFFAREFMIRANTRLVVSIARRYNGRGVPLLDLIQEGNMGLMRAVEKYDYQRGFRFSTYATWWIRQSITRAIAYQGRTIRVPVHMFDRLRQLYKSSMEIEQSLGRRPTAKELAEYMNLDIRKVRWMQQVAQIPISLETPIGEDGSEFSTLVEDRSSPSPAQIAYQNMLSERVKEVLSTLLPREARILRLRFGLGHERAYTLEEVGKKFGLTRERIRQIEGKALRQLRHPNRARMLRDYV